MASFNTAFAFIMATEDPTMVCAVEPDEPGGWDKTITPHVWNGAHAISGINSAAFPTQYAAVAALPQDQRLPIVREFYRTVFWNTWYAQIVSDDLAKRLLDSAVNQGPSTAVEVVQSAVNRLGGAQIEVDGYWGPLTIAAVNNQNPVSLLNAFMQQRIAKYQESVDKKPALAHYLGTAEHPGPWWIRATK